MTALEYISAGGSIVTMLTVLFAVFNYFGRISRSISLLTNALDNLKDQLGRYERRLESLEKRIMYCPTNYNLSRMYESQEKLSKE